MTACSAWFFDNPRHPRLRSRERVQPWAANGLGRADPATRRLAPQRSRVDAVGLRVKIVDLASDDRRAVLVVPARRSRETVASQRRQRAKPRASKRLMAR